MTYSILGFDRTNEDLGVAMQSSPRTRPRGRRSVVKAAAMPSHRSPPGWTEDDAARLRAIISPPG